jgi:hypothetical protein
MPLLHSPSADNTFRVVGQYFVARLCGSVGLLGPLPGPWKVQIKVDEGVERYYYVNSPTGQRTFNDLRLGFLNE